MLSDGVEIIIPDSVEDAAINAGIADDPDTFELSEEWFTSAKSSDEAVPHILERYRLSRGNKND